MVLWERLLSSRWHLFGYRRGNVQEDSNTGAIGWVTIRYIAVLGLLEK